MRARQLGRDYDEDCKIVGWCGGRAVGEEAGPNAMVAVPTPTGEVVAHAGDFVVEQDGQFYVGHAIMLWGPNASKGAKLVVEERQRQQAEEGYTVEHDRQHAWPVQPHRTPLVRAAIAYLHRNIAWWPWDVGSFKLTPEDRVRELVKAAALAVAEVDRLLDEE